MNEQFPVDSLIKKMAAEHQPELPAPGLIWWRAEIRKKQREKERIERPLKAMRLLAAAVCLALFAWLWISQPDAVRNTVNAAAVPLLLLAVVVAVTIVVVGVVWWARTAGEARR